jgi:hypothetical protein
MLSGATRPFLSAVMGARMAWRRFMGKERDDVPACPEGEDDNGGDETFERPWRS